MSYDEKLRAVAATADIHDRCARLEFRIQELEAALREIVLRDGATVGDRLRDWLEIHDLAVAALQPTTEEER